MDLSVWGGQAGLSELVIHNPPGYQHEHLLKLGRGQVKLRVLSLLSERVEIEQIRLSEVELFLEQRGLESNNLQDILRHLSHRDQPAEASKKKLHIGELDITSVTVHVKLLPIPGKIDTITLNLSPIRMTDLGSDNQLDTAALSEKILLAISGGIIEKGKGVLPAEFLNPLAVQLAGLGALPEALIKTGVAILTNPSTEIFKGVEGVGKGLGEIVKPMIDSLVPKAGKEQATSIPQGSRGKTRRGHTTDLLNQVKDNLTNQHAVLIDVREQSEWDAGHLRQGRLVPLSVLRQESQRGDFSERVASKLPKGKIIYLHCRSGGRVLAVDKLLSKLGYDVRPLKAGYDDLVSAGFETATE
ncbi:MAG: hypothetical protein IID32_03380 [Planctomycetes bacterium]|nr:hypothetical protein [Planctomycetota bacterium]